MSKEADREKSEIWLLLPCGEMFVEKKHQQEYNFVSYIYLSQIFGEENDLHLISQTPPPPPSNPNFPKPTFPRCSASLLPVDWLRFK
ncbi:hypothetical protein RND71_029317 [Anisodus tanguticus]|uniref:Uncharacterized protein n=1 Tax=Anisodus tanguticus TaxID=243964 RepID=A0AAE1V669_9SOLA|nr:hypothetical protein RND71_029317 [Anisodus tanguticus]